MCNPWTLYFFRWRNTDTKTIFKATPAHLGYIAPLSGVVVEYLFGPVLPSSNIECLFNLFSRFESPVESAIFRRRHLRIVDP